MMKKTGAGLLWFSLAFCLLGVCGNEFGIAACGQEFKAVSQAGDLPIADSQPTESVWAERVNEARSQIELIDSQLAALEDEEKTQITQVREGQRTQYDIREQILGSDEELQEMVRRIEVLQSEIHTLQEAFSKRMMEKPEYVAQHARQTAAIERSGAIQREAMELANKRVLAQRELQTLERRRSEVEGGIEPEPANADTTPSAEDPDQL